MALTKKTTKELEEKVTKKEYLNDMENVWHTIDRIEDNVLSNSDRQGKSANPLFTKKAIVKLKKGGEVRKIARGCGKVMSNRRKKTKYS